MDAVVKDLLLSGHNQMDYQRMSIKKSLPVPAGLIPSISK
jgi:hypothetical protein